MKWHERLAIVAAINSAGFEITEAEARDMVIAHGGEAEWVNDPPEWVDLINQCVEEWHGQHESRKEYETDEYPRLFE